MGGWCMDGSQEDGWREGWVWASCHPGSVCGCWLHSSPDASESPGFLLGWANAMHSWVMEGGGPSAPIPSL